MLDGCHVACFLKGNQTPALAWFAVRCARLLHASLMLLGKPANWRGVATREAGVWLSLFQFSVKHSTLEPLSLLLREVPVHIDLPKLNINLLTLY